MKNMNTKYTIIIAIVAIAIIAGSVVAYTYLSNPGTTVILNGSGASFPYPLLNSIITKYTNDVKSTAQINY
jgi:ABC-type phosphate transport system substrate-binding protein